MKIMGPTKRRDQFSSDDSTNVLVQSGPISRRWLLELRQLLPEFDYREVKFWAVYRKDRSTSPCAYLNPSKNSIRLFVRLEEYEDENLTKTPSTREWAKQFPAIYRIEGHAGIMVAADLIRRSSQRMSLPGQAGTGRNQ